MAFQNRGMSLAEGMVKRWPHFSLAILPLCEWFDERVLGHRFYVVCQFVGGLDFALFALHEEAERGRMAE